MPTTSTFPVLSVDPVRRSLWLALGLLAACPNDPPAADTTNAEPPASDTGDPVLTTGDGGSSAESSGSGGGSSSGDTGAPPVMGETTTDAGDTSSGASTSSTTADPSTTSGTTGGDTTSGDTTSGDTTGEPPPACMQLMQGFTDPPLPSGWELCEGGLAHRVEPLACAVPATPAACDPNLVEKECETNAECNAKPFGSCQTMIGLGSACLCIYGCQTDADCDAGFVCRCGGDGLGAYTECVPSECERDSDCGDEVCQFANEWAQGCGFGLTRGGCTTLGDECVNDEPCGNGPCVKGEAEFWHCTGQVCGRPWFVEDRAVTAAASERADWQAGCVVAVAEPELHAALAEHWTAIGLAEHASVASFAGFILQLLAVGAPAELVRAGQQALADEIDHARVCFALAGLYAGHPVGPGPLATSAAVAVDREAVLAAVIREACVAETLSALEVRESAARAEDPALARLLTRIADDEQRHAELGWRYVRWALQGADEATLAGARATFAAAIAEATETAARMAREPASPALRGHGVVDPPLRAALWRDALAGLLAPTVEVLCAA